VAPVVSVVSPVVGSAVMPVELGVAPVVGAVSVSVSLSLSLPQPMSPTDVAITTIVAPRNNAFMFIFIFVISVSALNHGLVSRGVIRPPRPAPSRV
jgi:hypothetical protein